VRLPAVARALLPALGLFAWGAFGQPAEAHADEGMWPFNRVPVESIKKDHGVTLTDAWLHHLRSASLRFNSGGSGAFVSPTGLVLTNHHVASDCIAKLSSPNKDYLADGYAAGQDGPEVRCPDLELNQLVRIDDVTGEVRSARQPGMNDADANVAIKGAMSRIEKTCSDRTALRCDVVTLYAGGMYQLYAYKKYTDVRLVFAPEVGIAFFGGDADNFTFPRYDYDLALFRVYENGRAVHPDDYLRLSPDGPKEGDTVFVSGNPGRTDRMDTLAQLARLRDVVHPYYLDQLARERELLLAFGKESAEHVRQIQRPLFGIENSRKALLGMQQALQSPARMTPKANDESALRKAIDADPDLKAQYGSVFDDIERVQNTFGAMYKRYAALERGPNRSQLFRIARDLVRLPRELATPNDKRLREYRASNLDSLKLALFSPAPIYGGVEVQMWRAWLERMVRDLGARDPLVQTLLAGLSPGRAAEQIVAGTRLTDVYARRALFDGGQGAVDAATDPLVSALRTLDVESRTMRRRYEDEVEGPMRLCGERVAQAVFAVRGVGVYPDATFTLRLSLGRVRGYVEGGTKVPWATDFAGMYKHATGVEPFKLPRRWLERAAALAPATPLNFVSTADIVGGSSGSPVVGQDGRLVGLIFDGNISSLGNDFVYGETTERAVSVDSAALLEALSSVFGEPGLKAELLDQAPSATSPNAW
jgi:peptidase S46-like protein